MFRIFNGYNLKDNVAPIVGSMPNLKKLNLCSVTNWRGSIFKIYRNDIIELNAMRKKLNDASRTQINICCFPDPIDKDLLKPLKLIDIKISKIYCHFDTCERFDINKKSEMYKEVMKIMKRNELDYDDDDDEDDDEDVDDEDDEDDDNYDDDDKN